MEESDLNASASVKTETGKTKTKRPRATTTSARPRVTKAKGTKAKASAGESSAPEPTLFNDAASEAPAPKAAKRERESAPEVQPAPVVRHEVQEAPAQPPPAPERAVFVPSGEASASSDFGSASISASAPARQDAGENNSTVPSGGQNDFAGSPGPTDQHGNGGGGFQSPAQSQSEDDRGPWWKRKKDRKKNKWQEKHQGRPGGGHHAHALPHVQHPPQPPPPVFVQHYGDLPDPARFADLVALDALATDLLTGNGAEPIRLDQIYALNITELVAYARKLGMVVEGAPNRIQVLGSILRHAFETRTPLVDRGWIDLTDKGYGFIVHEQSNYRLYPENSYLPEVLVRRYGLKRGHQVEVVLQTPQGDDRCPAVVGVRSVMGMAPELVPNIIPFEELVPYYPLQRILLEAPEIHKDISMRAVDLLTPIGFGQRGLLVAPPRTGKTVLLQNIANSITHNFPEKKLILLLIDERPEEVTDFRRHTQGEVVSSTFDEAPESHVHAAEMVIEKARRLVELGEHVIILLDSITRLARAYNALAANSGKIMSGGVEATALQKPKRFFGSARNIEGGGSITIIGTALIDTGSRMDEVIFEEFKGTGNMELHLDRGLSDKRIFPAINIDRSGTRKEELIYHPEEMLRVYGLRRAMQGIPPVEAMDMLIQRLKKTKTNAEFLLSLNR